MNAWTLKHVMSHDIKREKKRVSIGCLVPSELFNARPFEVAKISLADLVTFEEGVSEGRAGHFSRTLRVLALTRSCLEPGAVAWSQR